MVIRSKLVDKKRDLMKDVKCHLAAQPQDKLNLALYWPILILPITDLQFFHVMQFLAKKTNSLLS